MRSISDKVVKPTRLDLGDDDETIVAVGSGKYRIVGVGASLWHFSTVSHFEARSREVVVKERTSCSTVLNPVKTLGCVANSPSAHSRDREVEGHSEGGVGVAMDLLMEDTQVA